ncbi:MAG: phenylalanine--tRNA ligase subunit beta [Patescibacteria group bacterium]|nr:phenylalanine--tRNA ligase subunit beta [Patescibacteria group bacterium]
MNILILDSWLREYLISSAHPEKIAQCFSLSGPSVERLTKVDSDWLYDIEVTTNRVDLMSVIGIAREGAAILPQFGIKAQFKNLKPKEGKQVNGKLSVKISDPSKTCKRILAVVIDNVKIAKSPEYIQKRLKAAGVRSLNNLVDITNYVMLEVGHPTHVFDYDLLKTKKLIFRRAKKGEKITTLESKTYSLAEGDIVIDNGEGEIIDLPSIIGTENSVVRENTKRILFFIESSDPVQIRKTSMRLGIRTLAATINEKSVSPTLAKIALLRGTELYQQIAKGTVASKIYDIYPKPIQPKKINLSTDQIDKILGVSVSINKTLTILNSLGIESKASPQNKKEISTTIPYFRANDLNLSEDLIEEIARIYGYHNLPSILPAGQLPLKPLKETKQFYLENEVKKYLSNWGYTEIYCYSMISLKEIEKSGLQMVDHLKLSNPLSEDWQYLRSSLISSLINTVKLNLHQEKNLALFELSNVYHPKKKDLPEEVLTLGLGRTGEDQFYRLKGLVEELFKQLGLINFSFAVSPNLPNYYEAKSAAVIKKDELILGYLGMVSQKILYEWGINVPLVVTELDFALLSEQASLIKTYTPISPYPPIIEDFTFIFKKDIQLGTVLEAISKIDKLISNVRIVNRYEETITFRITFQATAKPLSAGEIIPLRKQLVEALEDKFNAQIKGKV